MRIKNDTGETLGVYGPKADSAVDNSAFDNTLYSLLPGHTTPENWDCDGFYVPSDRVADQLLSERQGPLAIKYVGFPITKAVTRHGNKYSAGGNQGAFSPAESICPSDYPQCVCWQIPNIGHEGVDDLPRVPNAGPA